MTALATNLITPLDEWQALREQANVLVKSGMLPASIRTPEAAIAIMLKGKELRIPPMQAFAHIHIIDGKPCQSAENMMMLILRDVPDARIKFLQNDHQACRIEASRIAVEKTIFGFSVEDAEKAQLLGPTRSGKVSTWQKFTRAMLRCRAVSEMGRAMFPDALGGCSYTPEELGARVTVSEAGIVEVEAEVMEEHGAPAPEHMHGPISQKYEEKKARRMEQDPPPKAEPKPEPKPAAKEKDNRWDSVFTNSPAAWAWLEKMLDSYYLAEDCRRPIRHVAVGKTARELDQLAQCAASGHDDPMNQVRKN